MKEKKRVYSIRIAEVTLESLKKLAISENRTLSNLVETILLDHLIKEGRDGATTM